MSASALLPSAVLQLLVLLVGLKMGSNSLTIFRILKLLQTGEHKGNRQFPLHNCMFQDVCQLAHLPLDHEYFGP